MRNDAGTSALRPDPIRLPPQSYPRAWIVRGLEKPSGAGVDDHAPPRSVVEVEGLVQGRVTKWRLVERRIAKSDSSHAFVQQRAVHAPIHHLLGAFVRSQRIEFSDQPADIYREPRGGPVPSRFSRAKGTWDPSKDIQRAQTSTFASSLPSTSPSPPRFSEPVVEWDVWPDIEP